MEISMSHIRRPRSISMVPISRGSIPNSRGGFHITRYTITNRMSRLIIRWSSIGLSKNCRAGTVAVSRCSSIAVGGGGVAVGGGGVGVGGGEQFCVVGHPGVVLSDTGEGRVDGLTVVRYRGVSVEGADHALVLRADRHGGGRVGHRGHH
jgi:hypothetical protein